MNLKLKGVPADVARELKAEAKLRKVSLNDYLLEVCQQYADDAETHRRMSESRAALNHRIAKTPRLPSSVPLIRKDRKRRK